jgi:hypothetical protein
MKLIYCSILLVLLASCKKVSDLVNSSDKDYTSYIEYEIPKGEHSTKQNTYKETEYSELRFLVKFDNSAVYTTINADNQLDVNKLYGFSDNNGKHHEFSARIGWRWSDGALRLFGYVYNNGVFDFKQIAAVSIGAEHECSIKVAGDQYIFSVDGHSIAMPRASTGLTAIGYKLFPYFGGDETAPHDIRIWIKEK